MEATFRRYAPEDWEFVVNLNLRREDRDEVRAATGYAPAAVLSQSLRVSKEAWVITLGGEIVGVFGLADMDEIGVPWMLSTDKIKLFKKEILKQSLAIVEYMRTRYPLLSNLVSSQNRSAIRWLRWLGFSFMDNIIYLKDPSVGFLQFYLWREGGAQRV